MLTVHVIFNAHIDPVWLWPWPAGMDEVLATCRSACDRLDANPDVVFSKGEAWAYRLIEELDPPLFARIRKHIEAGRWEIVGGWWIQPDCNQPSGWAMQKQIELGQRYFQKTFGHSPQVAYNVDSFGHAATLPGYIHQAGQRYYVMMRPQEHEMTLPARLFRWRGYPGTPEIVTFRIAGGYGTPGEMGTEHFLAHVRNAATHLPEGIEHTMCFMGVGNHGGGPTEQLVALCRQHATAIEGVRLLFSSPRRFFEAVAPQITRLPLVTGELQMHAVGCFSVQRSIKTALRCAEHYLAQAEFARALAADQGADTRIEEAWQRVAFNHFHDVLGGTCIPSAFPALEAQLGQALAIADDAVQFALRRRSQTLPDDPLERVVLFNASSEPFDGYTHFDIWGGTPWRAWTPEHQLLDETGRIVPCQGVEGEGVMQAPLPRVVCRVRIPAGQIRVLRIRRQAGFYSPPGALAVSADGLAQPEPPVGLKLAAGQMLLGGLLAPLPRLDLLVDASDTWSHGVDRYIEGPALSANWNHPALIEFGPLRAAMIQTGVIGHSPLRAEWRLYAGEPFVELILRVDWREEQKLLKLVCTAPEAFQHRTDGILGGHLERPLNGQELPLRDFTLLGIKDNRALGIVCPDLYAMDATAQRVRLTLLRSPLMAHNKPNPTGTSTRSQYADRGEHSFRFRFWAGTNLTPPMLDRQALMMQRPLVYAFVTNGMPCHFGIG